MLFAVVSAARIGAFCIAIISPPLNEFGLPVSPLVEQSGIDIQFYQDSRAVYFGGDFWSNVKTILSNISPETGLVAGTPLAAPGFPLLLEIFQYGANNTWPLSIFFLVMSTALAVAWINWMRARDLALIWLLMFAALPHPLWFMLNISSDLVFAAVASLYFFAFSAQRHGLALLLLVMSLLVRPHGVSLVLFAALHYLLLQSSMSRNWKVTALAICACALAALAPIYAPHFLSFVKSTDQIPLFGITQREYLNGIFDDLPMVLDLLGSWAALFGAKLLYLTGLRPSYSDIPLVYLMLRSSAGLVLLPGLIFLAWRGDNSHRLFVACILLPVLAGATQDRYNLVVQPLLFYYGCLAYQRVGGIAAATLKRS